MAAVPDYCTYTLDRYHRALNHLDRLKWRYGVTILATMVVAGLAFAAGRSPASALGWDLRWLTLVWLAPVPFIIVSAWAYFRWFNAERFRIAEQPPLAGRRSIVRFQVTSTGVNVETVLNSLRSVLYWTRRHPEVCYDSEVWLLAEEWGYGPIQDRYEEVLREGVRLLVTPTTYRTPRSTGRKARSLQYSVEQRRREDIDLSRTWVYHQDDETAIGEDTVLGIDEFIRNHGDQPALGAGVILYPQHAADFRPSQIAEFHRTSDDIRVLYSLTQRSNLMSGYHGSHYLIRADVEDRVGWDIGSGQTSEDLILEARVRETFGDVAHLLKGFAYEQAPLDLRDQFRQRRRWFQGWWRAVPRIRLPLIRRLLMTAGMLIWLAGVLSLATLVLSWIFVFGPVYALPGLVAGFLWPMMVIRYHQGYAVTKEYLPRRAVPLYRLVAHGIVGALVDGLAPWYGTFTRRPQGFEVIRKDCP